MTPKTQALNQKYNLLSEAQKSEVSTLIEALLAQNAKPKPPQHLTHRAVGRLIFEQPGPDGREKPLHHIEVELWDRDVAMPDDFLGAGKTDQDGCFEIWYNPADAGWKDEPDLELHVYDDTHTYDENGQIVKHRQRVYSIKGNDNVTTQTYDFGVCWVPYWEYDPVASTPRVLVVEHDEPPQAYASGRTVAMVKAAAPLEVIKRKHLFTNKFNKNAPSLEAIQNDYPENLTLRLEKQKPGYTRSDEYFGERILNGMSATILDRDPQQPHLYWIHHHWNSYEQNGIYALPNVDMYFELRDEKLYPVKITLQLRRPGQTAPNSPTEKLTFTPADGEKWLQAKRIARVSSALVAELDTHLVTTHLNTEQYAIAAYRNLRDNPLRYLLFPHVKEVVLIDHSANSLLLGETGFIARATGLTADSINQRARQVLGTLDWKNWSPQPPICQTHIQAKAANLFWEAVTDYVDQFFAQYEVEIIEHWYEIHRFSQDVMDHSVPLFLCHYLRGKLLEEKGDQSWFSANERMDLHLSRQRGNGELKAVSPFTLSDTPAAGDLENLKQLCRYIVFHATYKHTWSNARQYDDGGEILYSCLGLRYGKNGILGPETDYTIAPPPDIVTEQLWISYMLSNAGYGYLMRNEDKDIHPAFIEALRCRKAAFDELGLDIDTIQSRTNI